MNPDAINLRIMRPVRSTPTLSFRKGVLESRARGGKDDEGANNYDSST